MPGILTDGYLIGAASAAAMTSGGTMPDDWQPGGTDTAEDIIGALGLSAGLAAVTNVAPGAANTVAGSYMTILGRALVDGATAGLSAAAIGASLTAVLADTVQAASEVAGQIVPVIGQAAMALYQSQQVEYGRWVTDPEAGNVCPICDANEAAGRRPIGDPYPSGDDTPPVHPRCNCAVVPD